MLDDVFTIRSRIAVLMFVAYVMIPLGSTSGIVWNFPQHATSASFKPRAVSINEEELAPDLAVALT